MTIPVRNLYRLLLYAYDALDPAGEADTGAVPDTRLADLFARVLADGVEHLARRGLDRGYRPVRESLPGVRGRIDMATTIKTNGLRLGRVACEFDDLTPDVPHNRVLKATARRLLGAADLAPGLHDRLAGLVRGLGAVADMPLSAGLFRSVQLYRGQRFYRHLLAVCRMVFDHLLPDEAGGGWRFRAFERDERRMRKLFERFVRNFYRREQLAFRLWRRGLKWHATGDVHLLPAMQTDTTLRRGKRIVVVETKYTANQLQAYHSAGTVRSDHLYQLFAYLRNLANVAPACGVEGVLLYPRVGPGPDARCVVHGHSVRVVTLDLAAEWPAVHGQLLGLLGNHK